MRLFLSVTLLSLLLTVHAFALSLDQETNQVPSEQVRHAKQVQSCAMRAKSIVLPALKFRDTPIDEAFETLADLSIEHAPDSIGVSFIINLDPDVTMPRITLHMGKTSVLRAVDLIAKAANVTYRIDSAAIIVRSLREGERTQ